MPADPDYLAKLKAARDAILARAATGTSSYSLDGESATSYGIGDLETIDRLIKAEENRTPGRREMRVVRGRRYYGWR